MAAHRAEPIGPELPGLQFQRWLGSGGFSDVFLYERDHPRIKVAVKVLKADALDQTQLRQFMAEAEAMAELSEHPFIVSVLGSGTTAAGQPYLEMAYYPQANLAERASSQPLTVPDALKIGIQLASAIETAHRANIIHRDIKPANVLMSSYAVPGLTDFGVAGRPGEASEEDDNVGVSMPWSPPEILSGASNGTRASDVYSLAATVWHLLTGRAPFSMPGGDNTDRAMFARILHSKPPSVGRADAPSSLERLLQMALSKSPEHRPQTAIEFGRQLQRVEQELRLARTEIVVLDAQVQAPSPSLAPAKPAADKTALKSPLSVSPTAPPKTDSPPTTRPPRSPMTDGNRDSPLPARSGAALTARPLHKASANATQRRPTAAPTEPEAQNDGSVETRRPVAAIAATVVLLVAIIGVGAHLLRDGSKPKPSKLPGNGTSGLKDIGGVPDQVAQPNVNGAPHGATAVFTWTQDNPSDTYLVGVVGSAKTSTTSKPTWSVPFGNAREICIVVTASRAGASSAISTPGCASR